MNDLAAWPHLFTPGDPARPVLLTLHGTGSDERDIAQIAGILDPTAAVLSPRGKVSESGMLRWFARRGEGVFDVDDVVFRSGELVSFLEWARDSYRLGHRQIVAVGLSNGANIALATALLNPSSISRVIAFSGMYPLGDRLPETASASTGATVPADGVSDVDGVGVVGGEAPDVDIAPGGSDGRGVGGGMPDVVGGGADGRGVGAPTRFVRLLSAVDVILLNGSADPMAPPASVDLLERVLRERGARVERATRPGGHGITQVDIDAARAWL